MTTTERFDLDFNPSLDRVCAMPDLCLCDEPQDQMLYRLEFSKRPWTTNAERNWQSLGTRTASKRMAKCFSCTSNGSKDSAVEMDGGNC
jgi:hypothetical protein